MAGRFAGASVVCGPGHHREPVCGRAVVGRFDAVDRVHRVGGERVLHVLFLVAGVAHQRLEPSAAQHRVYDDGAACGAGRVVYDHGELHLGELGLGARGGAVSGVEGQRMGDGLGPVPCVLEPGCVHRLYGEGAGVELCGLGPDRHSQVHDPGGGPARAHGAEVRGDIVAGQVLLECSYGI